MKQMNRIDKTFAGLKKAGKKALITFVTAGDPSAEVTRQLVLEMERQGADLIELGIPFSDPIAEGPVIQRANERALSAGFTLSAAFGLVRALRQKTQVPLVFLMYYNHILHYGPDRFFTACRDAGVDGVILPDLPFEESGEIAPFTEQYGVYQISMVSPTSSEARLKAICGQAKGFLYCVSSMGVTGMRSSFGMDFDAMFRKLDRFTDTPKCLGFGISTPEHIQSLKHYCDGLIVGSALVNQVAEGGTGEEKVRRVGSLTRALKAAF